MKISIRKFLEKIGLNRAVLYGVAGKTWASIAGFVTLVLITMYFSPQLQGYYFTFSSLLALQVFIELGFSTVVVNFTSHEWAKLGFDERGHITGDKQALARVRELAKIMFIWYSVGAIILFVAVGAAGYVFFAQSKQVGVHWVAPWIFLCFTSGVNFFLMLVFSLLEGSNQVASIYFARFIQEMIKSVICWAVIILKGGLWALPASILLMNLWAMSYFLKKYSNYFISLFSKNKGLHLAMLKEIWPMQWRIAVTSLTSYFYYPLFVTILFRYVSPDVAGQAGMTLGMTSMLTILASMWIVTKVPQFGILTSKRDYVNLDRMLLRSGAMAVIFGAAGAAILYSAVSVIYSYDLPLASRMLPPLPTALFLSSAVLQQIFIAISTSLRAHKKEPLMWISIFSALLMLLLTFVSVRSWGVVGVAASHLSLTVFFGIPLSAIIWLRCRKLWRKQEYIEPELIPDGNIIT